MARMHLIAVCVLTSLRCAITLSTSGSLVAVFVGTKLISASSRNQQIANVKEMLGRIKAKIENIYFPITSKEEQKCRWYDVSAAIKTVTDSEAILGDSTKIDGEKLPVMVQTNCFEIASLGNQLSNYFEARICAHLSGVHYLSLSHMMGDDNKPSHPFFKGLSSLVRHPSPVESMDIAKLNVKKYCTCGSICHEWTYGLMHRHAYMVRNMFLTALQVSWDNFDDKHFLNLSSSVGTKILIGKNITTYDVESAQSSAIGQELPMIPDVAIHYRCGDNTVTHYGFTPFRVFAATIPQSARSIYVMAESPSRNARPDRTERCTAIFKALRSYLTSKFPMAVVLILRGHDVFEDLARLTYANTTICSVSTYCLWPAMSNKNTVYFPVTKLIAKENTSFNYGSSFHWLAEDKYKAIRGSEALHMSHAELVNRLSAG